MSDRQPKGAPGEASRFRAVVVAALRSEQLRRDSKRRIELDGKRHKDTSIAMEEVRRGFDHFYTIRQTPCSKPCDEQLAVGVEPFLPAIR